MGRVYSGRFSGVATDAVLDFFELLAPADMVVKIHEIRITQHTEAGDAESEQLLFEIKRASGSYTSGSGGTTPTPAPLNFGDAASTVTLEANNTSQAAAGTGALTTLLSAADNIHNGFHYLPTPETQIILSPSQALIVSLGAAPQDSITFDGYIVFEEIGG